MKESAEKEFNRVKQAVQAISIEKNLDKKELKKAQDIMQLIKSYYIDAEYFCSKQKYIECFELCVYIFGLLDSAARLGFINPGKARKHFKVEQD